MLLRIKRLTVHQSFIKNSSKQEMMRIEQNSKTKNDELMRKWWSAKH
jgi:hypothetical protein